MGFDFGIFLPEGHDPLQRHRKEKIDPYVLDYFIDIPVPQDYSREGTGLLVNKKDNTAFLPVIYGQQRVGGTIVFLTTTGTDNQYLHLVLALGEGEIEAIDNVYIDDVISTDTRFDGLVRINSYVGTDAQAADADLIAETTEWTSDHKLSGVAYVYVRLNYDASAFSQLPVITCDVRGRLVKDIRTSPHTIAYSNNPALCIRDYLTNARYGKGLDESLIDDTALAAAADYCDTSIVETTSSPQTQISLYGCDGTLDTSKRIFDNVKALLSSCNGWLPFINGKYTLLIDKAETDTSPSTIFTFDEDNIVGGWAFGKRGSANKYNRVLAKFRNPNRNWQYDVVVDDNVTLRLEDNNKLLSTDLDYPFDISPYRVEYKAGLVMKDSRQNIYVSFSATTEAWKVSIGDVVQVTHATPGWTAKLFRVRALTLLENGLVGVALKEYEATVYDRTVPAEQPTAADTNLPNPYSVGAPSAIVLDSGTDRLYIRQDGTVASRLFVSWNPSNDIFVVEYVVEYKQSAEATFQVAGVYRGLNTNECYIADVQDDVNYDVRIKAINSLGIESAYVTSTNHTVLGKTEPPPDCDNLIIQRQADGTRQFDGGLLEANVPLDFAGYKIRYILSDGSPMPSWANMTKLHEGVITALPWETNQLAAGDYVFGIKAVDTSGNVSTNALLGIASLGDPRLSNALLSVDPRVLGWPGTKTDCWVTPAGNLNATGSKTWADFATDSPQVTWADWLLWSSAPSSPIVYEHSIIDVGVVAAFTPLVSVDSNGSTITIEESHSDGDTSPWSWSSWAAVSGQITARYIKIRVTVSHATELLYINAMNIILDANVISEIIEDLDTSTIGSPVAAGDFRLPITQSYALIRRVNISLQNVGAGYTWEVIDKNATLGPRIKIYNSSNVSSDAVIDAEIIGL